MPILIALGSLLLLALVFGPQLLVKRVLRQHGADRPDLPGTGAELAATCSTKPICNRSLSKRPISVIITIPTCTRALLPQHHDGRSVAAVAVAAHEVSHAVQHARGETAFMRRLELIRSLVWVERVAGVVLMLTPIVLIVVRSPALAVLQVIAGIALLGIRVVVHATTLPVEFDASFGKALPVLVRGRYLGAGDMQAARGVLKAAAYTYVAAALASLLDVARWFRILRF
jgi:hypothetical protein